MTAPGPGGGSRGQRSHRRAARVGIGLPNISHGDEDFVGTPVAMQLAMLKLIGSAVLAKVLGFGLVGFIVIYALLTLLT